MKRERGVALLVTMLLLVAVLLLGASASTMALLGERSVRAERDRLIAFQAAEDVLMDAEDDIKAARSPVVIPTPPVPPAPPPPAPPGPPGPDDPPSASASSTAPPPGVPAWQLVDLEGAATTEFGALSGAVMETGEGTLPFRRPRYFAERLARPGGGFHYRVTVIGFGNRPGTEAVLQSTYRRAADAPPGPGGRLSWREITNWRELHAAASGKEDKP
jgi:type IV pilus assembly protein PilX